MKKNLLSQINKLKEVQPDKEWKAQNQEFLRTHLVNDIKPGFFSKLAVWMKSFASASSQPAFALTAFVLILITGITFFNPLLLDAKPNESLYIARIISEKAQVNMTFNKENREKLSAQFATNHAKDITDLMNDPEFHKEEGSEDKIADLSENFNKEINTAKESINNIHLNNIDNKTDGTSTVEPSNEKNLSDEESIVFSAETRKDDQGLEIDVKDNGEKQDSEVLENEAEPEIQINANGDTASSSQEITEENIESPEETDSSKEENASSTLNQLQSITKEVNKEGGDINEANIVLDEAQRLFNEEKYQEALDKLNEAEKILDKMNSEAKTEANSQ